MNRTLIALVVASTAFGGAAFAQDGGPGGWHGGPGGWRGGRGELSATDREAFADARIAAIKAGLKLTPDQDKLWPPVEDAMRNLAKVRTEAASARRERWASMRDGQDTDIPGQLRFMADRQAASSDALRKLADATGPLYGLLDDGQKRRLRILARFGGEGMRGGIGRFMHRGALDDRSRDFAAGDGEQPSRTR